MYITMNYILTCTNIVLHIICYVYLDVVCSMVIAQTRRVHIIKHPSARYDQCSAYTAYAAHSSQGYAISVFGRVSTNQLSSASTSMISIVAMEIERRPGRAGGPYAGRHVSTRGWLCDVFPFVLYAQTPY